MILVHARPAELLSLLLCRSTAQLTTLVGSMWNNRNLRFTLTQRFASPTVVGMNQRTAKLLRQFSLVSESSLAEIKRKWNAESGPRRKEVRNQMEAALFSTRLQTWRERDGLEQKEAAGILDVPFDTYQGWEYGKHAPTKIVIRAVLEVINRASSSPPACHRAAP